jgi:hypothetical protein
MSKIRAQLATVNFIHYFDFSITLREEVGAQLHDMMPLLKAKHIKQQG